MKPSRLLSPSPAAQLAFAEIAAHLGVTVRHVPHVRRRHLLRFDAAEAAAWLEQLRIEVSSPAGSSRFAYGAVEPRTTLQPAARSVASDASAPWRASRTPHALNMTDARIDTNRTITRCEHDTLAAPHFERLAISASEAAEALGCSISTVYRMIRAGQLRSARSSVNRRIFINLQSARDFVDGQTRAFELRGEERIRRLA